MSQTTDAREDILVETATAKLITRCVLDNGPEPNYATEKLTPEAGCYGPIGS